MRLWVRLLSAGAAATLGGCGTTLPIMDLAHPSKIEFEQFVQAIASHVRCELSKAVKREWPREAKSKRILLKTWVAKVGLTITADDKGQANPGIAFINAAQTFAGSVGAQFMADGTRVMSVTYFVPFQELVTDPTPTDERGTEVPCTIREREPIAGDLGIHQTLAAALQPWDGNDTLGETVTGGPFDTITHHVTFQVQAGASATPSWKFVNVTANTGGNFLSATRTRTDDLLITFGPGVLTAGHKLIPSPEINSSFGAERLRGVLSDKGGI
ncbi:hypothetical protein [Bradyrhizobium sp. 33ap4]|uniref:hypothetical protein n=1 Tax=Bradyrhizobium sp. 33ap4 TaxID=3061630 RepID=UPI0029307BFC|nr:hypothetical protein [Bradyrhizobium sp. 33ap4]